MSMKKLFNQNRSKLYKLNAMIKKSTAKSKPKARKNYKKSNKLDVVTKPSVVQYPSIGTAPLYSKTKYQKLAFTQDFVLTASPTTGVNYVFRANGCHDPDYSFGGDDPYGWAQMKALYGRYEVLSSTVQIIWNPKDLTNASRYHFRIFLNNYSNLDALALTDINNLIGAPGSNLATLGHVDENAIRQYSSARLSYKKSDLFLKDNDTSALTTADPAVDKTAYYVMCLFPTSASVSAGITNCPFRVRINYNVKFMDPIQYTG